MEKKVRKFLESRGIKVGQPKVHYICENPNDLPNPDELVLFGNDTQVYLGKIDSSKIWWSEDGATISSDLVNKWCYPIK